MEGGEGQSEYPCTFFRDPGDNLRPKKGCGFTRGVAFGNSQEVHWVFKNFSLFTGENTIIELL